MPVYPVIAPPDDKCGQYGLTVGFRDRLKEKISWFDVESGKITGLDYNMWVSKDISGFEMTKDEFLATLKYSLDLRLEGNRCPMMFGAHSNYYVPSYTTPNASNQDRKDAIEYFINYALQKPDVRVVTVKQILDWIRDPVALGEDTNVIDTGAISENLIEIAGWEPDVDILGSSADTGTSLIQNEIVKVKFTIVKQPDTLTWPWGTLTAYLENNFKDVTHVKFTYKCDKAFIVILPQEGLAEEGESYQFWLAESPDVWRTEMIRVKSFTQPSWVTETTPLDLTKINSLAFSPIVNPITGGTATMEFKDIFLFGYHDPVGTIHNWQNMQANSLSIGNITAKHINISIPAAGKYDLSLYSIDGKKIRVILKQFYSSGIHSIQWNGEQLTAGIYLFAITGNNKNAVKKAFLFHRN